ncbi:bifunctional serine/threonine-protein kinase/formylglycine-generating enzyme family protein [Zoogloea sp.]|uniref:bifunctional serine/threonine-protein kinase/formylglycine-generating enzyme family protein n=1 Tax=Zoogloea sp. TaxID=49181 RepID=UPI0025E87152|nr:bifunctional serine/threonine-protein kinase/formylglycine-generating enzyme family protein [Zoogloea sp.]MCK6394561.1 bifunctional serine/threonine-protein kinase/formylglycine-generating enzyme family protein [Zoogloea sp.]
MNDGSIYLTGSTPADGDGDLRALAPGTRINEFEIRAHLGSGGFGIVYEAWDHHIQVPRAIKEFLPNTVCLRTNTGRVDALGKSHRLAYSKGLEEFVAEGRRLAGLSHPGIVRVWQLLEANGTAYIVMDLLQGHTLAAFMEEAKEASAEQITDWLAQLLRALVYLHSAPNHLLHRDIKPANVFVLPDGRVVLMDFGAARQRVGEATQTLSAIISPGYSPIEQYDEHGLEQQNARTDLYALGATFYHLVSGVRPLPSTQRVIKDRLRPASELLAGKFPPALLAGIDRAMGVRLEARWASAEEWLKALAQKQKRARVPLAAPADPDAATGAGATQAARKPRPAVRVAGLLVAGLVVGGATWSFMSKKETPPRPPEPPAAADIPAPPPRKIEKSPPRPSLKGGALPEAAFQDCPDCPWMVPVPGGTLLIPPPKSASGAKARELRVGPVAVGAFEITRAEWLRFAEANKRAVPGSGCYGLDESDLTFKMQSKLNWKTPGYPVGDDQPATCVNFHDASDYAVWLSGITGKRYRLPTEAEWEYGARAGNTTPFPWGPGADQACTHANVADSSPAPGTKHERKTVFACKDGSFYPTPRGSFAANALGLFDFIGNAGEWTADCWRETPDAGKQDCDLRAVRGGSWFAGPSAANAEFRGGLNTSTRSQQMGFRLVREGE